MLYGLELVQAGQAGGPVMIYWPLFAAFMGVVGGRGRRGMTWVKTEVASFFVFCISCNFVFLLSPGCPQFDPLVEQPPVVELTEQARLRDCIR